MFKAVRTQFDTDPPKHRPTETPKHRNTDPPKHRNTETPTHRNTDRQIDHLVYDLYGLTEDESALVEDA